MKKTLALLAVLTSSASSAGFDPLLEALMKNNHTMDPAVGGTSKPGQIISKSESSTSSVCDQQVQTSLPLNYLKGLIQDKSADLSIDRDASRGKLIVKTPRMIGNCNSLLKPWQGTKTLGDDAEKVFHIVKLNFDEGSTCESPVIASDDLEKDKKEAEFKQKVEGKRCFKVHVWENGKRELKSLPFSPGLEGLKECLKATNVIGKDGEVNQKAVLDGRMTLSFNIPDKSGDIVWGATGPDSYSDRSIHQDKCDSYEYLSDDDTKKRYLSLADQESADYKERLSKVTNCGNYTTVSNFLSDTGIQNDQLVEYRNNLIVEEAKRVAALLSKDEKVSEKDLEIIQDFQRYIVNEKADRIADLFREAEAAVDTSTKNEFLDKMKKSQEELKEINKIFTANHTKKLLKDGLFDQAQDLDEVKLVASTYLKVGQKQGNKYLTPDGAEKHIKKERVAFAKAVAIEKERYAIRTGEVTGEANFYGQLTQSMVRNVQERTQNYSSEINAEYARMSQGGYCYASPYRNVQRCVADAQSRISELQQLMQWYNKVDMERAQEYDLKAKEYAQLEAEGRRYIAAQNGEEVVDAAPGGQAPTQSTLVPPQSQSGAQTQWSFQYNPGVQTQFQQPQGQNQQYPQQVYQPQYYQTPGVNYQYGGQNPYQVQQPQYPANYWQSPGIGMTYQYQYGR
jgi:hypothetical protein